MAPRNTRQLWWLGALVAVLMLVLMFNFGPSVPVASNASAPRAAADRRSTAAAAVDAVNLGALNAPRPDPDAGERNPFMFGRRAGASQAEAPGNRNDFTSMAAPQPVVPAGPPPPAPIALKFIGIVDQEPRLRVAVLTDGRNVFYGREGDTIEGRYRIERIGADSVDMAYVDGRGRQTIRLSGS